MAASWSLRETHGLAHWQRVERNGLLLADMDGGDVNLKVVRYFAYLHDSRRKNDGYDPQHGTRASELIGKLSHTLLASLTPQEIALLRTACVYHTALTHFGQPTIDTCFDADRLDLPRVGIQPRADKMASPQGQYFAAHPDEFLAATMRSKRSF